LLPYGPIGNRESRSTTLSIFYGSVSILDLMATMAPEQFQEMMANMNNMMTQMAQMFQ